MSTLNVTNISDGTNSTSTTNVVKGSAKAWVNFNGQGTVAIREAYNVGSITDNGNGDYTVNFTTALTDANYCVTHMCRSVNTNGNRGVSGAQLTDAASLPTASSFRIFTAYGSTASSDGSKEDQDYIMLGIFR